jgi:hypothetical protein
MYLVNCDVLALLHNQLLKIKVFGLSGTIIYALICYRQVSSGTGKAHNLFQIPDRNTFNFFNVPGEPSGVAYLCPSEKTLGGGGRSPKTLFIWECILLTKWCLRFALTTGFSVLQQITTRPQFKLNSSAGESLVQMIFPNYFNIWFHSDLVISF